MAGGAAALVSPAVDVSAGIPFSAPPPVIDADNYVRIRPDGPTKEGFSFSDTEWHRSAVPCFSVIVCKSCVLRLKEIEKDVRVETEN